MRKGLANPLAELQNNDGETCATLAPPGASVTSLSVPFASSSSQTDDSDDICSLPMKPQSTLSEHELQQWVNFPSSKTITLLCDGSVKVDEWGIAVCTKCGKETWCIGGIGKDTHGPH